MKGTRPRSGIVVSDLNCSKMKFIFRNIRGLIKKETFIFAVMLLCVFVSAWVMLFSYGLYQNYHALLIEGEETLKEIRPNISEGQALTYGELKTYLESIQDEAFDDLNIIYCRGASDFEVKYEGEGQHLGSTYNFVSRFTFKNGVVHYSPYIENHWNNRGMITTGRYFTDNEEINGVNVVMIPGEFTSDETSKLLFGPLFVDKNTIKLLGREYTVVGTHSSIGVMIPFLAMPPEQEVGEFAFYFENTVTRKKFNMFEDTAAKVIPGKLEFDGTSVPDSDSVYIYNNIMMLSVLIAALTIINFAFLYNFIFKKRSRQLAIMRICGCTRGKAWAICLGECIFLCVPVFLVGAALYIPFMHRILANLFEFMEGAYSLGIYLAIFGIYFVTLLVIMGIMLAGQISRTLTEGSKRAE